MTYGDIVQAIEQALEGMEGIVKDIAELSHASAVSEADFKASYAKVKLSARVTAGKLTEAHLTDMADVECADKRLTYLLASGRLSAARSALSAQQARLDGLRTLAAGMRQVT